MTDNSQNLQERNQQVLNNISQLQTQEKQLYDSLDDVTLSSDEKQQIINKINEISQMRMNMYASMKDMYDYYQKNVAASRSTLGQEVTAIDILENELNASKKRLNLLEDQKYNKLRLVEINTYYGKRYDAHSKIMKLIVIMCIPIITLSFLVNMGVLQTNLYYFLTGIVIIITVILLGYQIIDISNRDNMNWDEYNWYFDKSKAPSDTTEGTPSDPWGTPSVTCIGSACCYEGSTYDETKNMCVPNAVYQKEQQEQQEKQEQQEQSETYDVTESFKGLDKYGYTQMKSAQLNNNIMPTYASLSKTKY
jgi:hypothetical protein